MSDGSGSDGLAKIANEGERDDGEESPPQLRLVDEGLEMPEHLHGATGKITFRLPDLEMEVTFIKDGVPAVTDALVFPPTDPQLEDTFVPEGHIRIEGELYEVVDDRSVQACNYCGSGSVNVTVDPPKCYDCEPVNCPDCGETKVDATSKRPSCPDCGQVIES